MPHEPESPVLKLCSRRDNGFQTPRRGRNLPAQRNTLDGDSRPSLALEKPSNRILPPPVRWQKRSAATGRLIATAAAPHAPGSTRRRRHRLAFGCFLVSLACLQLCAAETPPPAEATGTLQVAGGDYVAGRLGDSAQPGTLAWQASAFVSPFHFDLAALAAVRLPGPAERPKPQGDYCFELLGGDVFFGSLAELTAEEARIEVPPFGSLHLQRKCLRSILRLRDGADLVRVGPVGLAEGVDLTYVGPSVDNKNAQVYYKGPNGLSEWEREHPHGAWQQEDGFLTTQQAGALLARNFDLPPQAAVEFELSWTGAPDFVLALGAGRHGYEQAFRLEVWDDDLVLLRETDQEADMVSLGKINTGSGRCHLLVYLDFQKNRAIVFSPEGMPLGELAVSESAARPQSCIRLVNLGGKLRLEQLRIVRWDGTPPREIQDDRSRLQRTDGAVVYGEVQSFDPATSEFLVADGETTHRIHADQTASIVMARSEVPPAGGVRVVLHDGTRITGPFDRLADGRLCLSSPAVTEPLAIPIALFRTLVVLDGRKPSSPDSGREGRLVMVGTSIHGRLVDGTGQPGASCLVWQPNGSTTASALAETAAARIIYRTPVPPARRTASRTYVRQGGRVFVVEGNQAIAGPAAAPVFAPQPAAAAPRAAARQPAAAAPRAPVPQPAPPSLAVGPAAADPFAPLRPVAPQPAPPGFVLDAMVRVLAGDNPPVARPPMAYNPSDAGQPYWFTPGIYLRTGDTIPCTVEKIDERGVTFKSSVFDATFVPHEKIKAVDLENRSQATKIDKTARDRLLMLPRMQKDDPPTHLIRSTAGDYLRARLVGLDEETLTAEVRLDTRKLPRRQIARIIWLGDQPQPPPDEPAADRPGAARVQALRSDGIRVTFVPAKLTGSSLEGTSDILGPCRVDLSQVDQLTTGSAIEEAATELPYQRWKLHDAPVPRFAQSEGQGEAGTQGTESALVGKPAPEFELETLDGSKFQLRQARGKVVVVEFWATWCGPCVDTLPQIVRSVDKLKDQGVLLVAVNLQESPDAIHSLLERLEINPTVALDRDGTVAEHYAAVAIPQTVIVDTAGNIARVFVGGGRQYEEQLQQALQAVLHAATSAPPTEAYPAAEEEPQ